jgi:hypothetical protein
MPNALHSRLNDLASSFASAVLDAIKGASLKDLHSDGAAPAAGPRARKSAQRTAAAPKTARARSGRLPRRSAEDIAGALDSIVVLVKKHKEGLRAEQIRKELGMEAKEMPRVLKEGITTRLLRTKGQKRATTYFAK